MVNFNLTDFIFDFNKNGDCFQALFLRQYVEDVQEKRISWDDCQLQTVKFITEYIMGGENSERRAEQIFALYPLAKELYILWLKDKQLLVTKKDGPPIGLEQRKD